MYCFRSATISGVDDGMKVQVDEFDPLCHLSLSLFTLELSFPVMGSGGGIRQSRRECRPMLVLRPQKNAAVKGFHICSLSFQVLQCC